MKSCSCLGHLILPGILWCSLHCTIWLTSLLAFLTDLAIVEERSLSLCHMPLNHPRWYSERHTGNSQWGSATGIPDFDHKIENLSSYPPLACAISCIFASVLARMIGKRTVYLISTTIFLISTVWCALTTMDYGSFFTARFISGLGLGAYEAIVLSTVGDLYIVCRAPCNS